MSNKANGEKKYWVGGAIAMGMGALNAGVGYAQQRKAQQALAQAEEDTAGTIRSKAEQLRTARQQFDVSTALDQNKIAAEAAASQLAEEGGLRGLMSGQSRIQRAQQMADMNAIGSLGQNAARMNEMAEMQQQGLVSQRNAGNIDRLARAADVGAQAKMQGLGQIGLGAAQFFGGGGGKALLKAFKKDNTTNEDPASTGAEDNGKTLSALDAMGRSVQSAFANPKFNEAISENGKFGDYETDYNLQRSQFDNNPKGFYGEHGGVMPTSDPEEVSGLKAMLKMIGGLFGKGKPKEVEEVEETEEVMETPGEFNHDTNPIDLVQDGEKIGEATGGEYIFNPEQSEMLKQLAAQGDSELHRYLRELLSREEFNEEEDYD
jgi:hypothetical protein